MLTLCDHPISSNALKVRFLLAELGHDYERREVPMRRPRPADYVALNPLAGIPTLVDGGLVLTESNAILRYLANPYGGEELYPADPRLRAPVDELLDRYSLTLRPAFFSVEVLGAGVHAPGRLRLCAGRPGGRGAARARRSPRRCGRFDALVDPSGYALGRFTIADCAAAPVLYRTTHTGMDLTPYPNLLRWRDTAARVRPSPRPNPCSSPGRGLAHRAA